MNNLPADILKIICYYLDVGSLEKLFTISEYLDNVLVYDFWKLYFENNNINITNKQDQPLSWINEYKTNEIMKFMLKSIPCQYICKGGKNKGMTCRELSLPGQLFCVFCMGMANKDDITENYVRIDCNNIEIILRDLVDIYVSNNSAAKKYLSLTNNTFLINSHTDQVYIYAITPQGCTLNYYIMDEEKFDQLLFNLFEQKEIISYQQITI